jgi:hypothetical protein
MLYPHLSKSKPKIQLYVSLFISYKLLIVQEYNNL